MLKLLRSLVTALALAAVLAPVSYAASSDKTFTVSNTGNGPLTITSTAISGNTTEFSLLSGHNCTTVAAGSSCSMTVRFTPTGTGTRAAASLNFNSNGTNGGAQSIALSGAGGGGASCALPWGGTLAHGSSVTAWRSDQIGCWALPSGMATTSCSAQSRTCNNGSLSGSYTEASCLVDVIEECSW
jgi:hypothetical protein